MHELHHDAGEVESLHNAIMQKSYDLLCDATLKKTFLHSKNDVWDNKLGSQFKTVLEQFRIWNQLAKTRKHPKKPSGCSKGWPLLSQSTGHRRQYMDIGAVLLCHEVLWLFGLTIS